MSATDEVFLWVGRVYSSLILLAVLLIFAAIAFGRWWDWREDRRAAAEYRRTLGRDGLTADNVRLLLETGPIGTAYDEREDDGGLVVSMRPHDDVETTRLLRHAIDRPPTPLPVDSTSWIQP